MRPHVPVLTVALSGALAAVVVGAVALPASAKTPVKTPTKTPAPALACTATDPAIYAAPTGITAAAGSLLACESANVSSALNSDTPATTAYKVRYATTDVSGGKTAASGTLIVPKAAWTGTGPRPIVAFNPGTLGLGLQCAFSKQISGAYQDEYEGGNLSSFISAGYAVAATDGIGYLNGTVHPYVVGVDSGHAVLDMAKIASQVPGAGLSASAPVGISGYSEGGGASLWAAQLAATYAPSLKIVGAAAGGVPGNLRTVATALNGGLFAGFLADAIVGLHAAYPTLPFDAILNQNGRDAVTKATSNCLIGTLGSFLGAKVESFTTAGYSLDQLYALGNGTTTYGQVVDASQLGVGIGLPGSGAKYTIGFPTLQYNGLAEEVVAPAAEIATKNAYCSAKIPTQFNQYLGEHLTTDTIAANDVTSWLGARFKGTPTTGNC